LTTVVCVLLALLTAIVMALLPAPRRWVRWVQALGVAVAVGLVMSLVFYIASDAYTLDSENIQMARVAAAV
jgi:type III secretory pathway component EscV